MVREKNDRPYLRYLRKKNPIIKQ